MHTNVLHKETEGFIFQKVSLSFSGIYTFSFYIYRWWTSQSKQLIITVLNNFTTKKEPKMLCSELWEINWAMK